MSFFIFNASSGTVGGVYNVMNYGAVGNSSHDDTTAINAAVTAAGHEGVIFFPAGSYLVTSAIVIPNGSSLIFSGCGDASGIVANFNGFVFDNLSNPYNPGGGISIIENLNIQNQFVGNTFSMPANGTWSSSGSPVSITLSGSNPGVAAGGALWVSGSGGLGTNSVFIGMITDVSSWPTVTVSSAAVGSGANSSCAMHVIQCYTATSWSVSAATITMAATRPAGIGTGQYYVYNYENYLADPRYEFPIGTATWSGTTVTFTPGYGGAIQGSVGSTDRLWFAPAAGAIRYSSTSMAEVRNCELSGFYGLTTSQDKIIPNDPTVGADEGFHVLSANNTFSNPSGFSGLLGQTGIYFQNNSIVLNNVASNLWCAVRISGTSNQIIGGRFEVNYFGIIIGGDFTPSNGSLSGGYIAGMSMESNIQALYCLGGNATITATGCSCNVSHQALGGFYLNGFSGSLSNINCAGHFGTGYGIVITGVGNGRGLIDVSSTSAVHLDTPSQSWSLPTQAWWGIIDASCDNPALEYTFANLPTGSSSPTPREGETYDISDCSTSTFLATAAGGGTGATAHRKVRYNATSSVWQVIG